MTETEHYLIGRYRRATGRDLRSGARILDFCCGAGRTVTELRAAGYDAFGFEPFAGNAPNAPEFSSWEWPNPHAPGGDVRSRPDWRGWRLPYPDGYFDFVYSEQVMEHVSDHAAIIGELARVTKPGGVQHHEFPGCWKLIEPHVNVPLGGIIKNYAWYLFWYAMGRRNGFLTDLPFWRQALHQSRYARSSLNYRSPRFFRRLGRRHFGKSKIIPRGWLKRRTGEVIWILQRPLHPYTTSSADE